MSSVNHEIIQLNPDLNMRYNFVEVTNAYTAMHWHDSIEILYVLSGQLNVTFSNETDHLGKGDFTVIDRKLIHGSSTKSPTRYLIIQIPYQFLKQFIANIDSLRFPYICSIQERDHRQPLNDMRDILEQLAKLKEHQYSGYQLKYYSLLFAFLDLLLKHYTTELSPKESQKTEKYIERLSTITEYVGNHYQEPITLQNAARVLAINPEYFSRFFKKYMGVTFLEYVYSIRLQAAYQDIINTDLSIQKIQDRNGFSSPKIFSRLFREQYGKTPREVRKERL